MILFCGCTESEEAIIPPLARYASLVCFSPEAAACQPRAQKPLLCIGKYRHIPRLEDGSKGILILGGDLAPQEKNKIPSGFLSVFDANNQNAAKLLVGTGAMAISCGSSPRDSLSLASRDVEACVVSLQRSVRTLAGAVAEPKDITMRLTREWGLFKILSFCAAAVLSGLDYGEDLIL